MVACVFDSTANGRMKRRHQRLFPIWLSKACSGPMLELLAALVPKCVFCFQGLFRVFRESRATVRWGTDRGKLSIR